jgi:hypothetical protein
MQLRDLFAPILRIGHHVPLKLHSRFEHST